MSALALAPSFATKTRELVQLLGLCRASRAFRFLVLPIDMAVSTNGWARSVLAPGGRRVVVLKADDVVELSPGGDVPVVDELGEVTVYVVAPSVKPEVVVDVTDTLEVDEDVAELVELSATT